MYTARTLGTAALVAAMLALAACGNTPAAGPDTTETPVQTEQPEATVNPGENTPPQESAEPSASPSTEEPEAPEEGMPPTALEAAATVIRALSNSNMETLSAWVSRDQGVRFSPYGYVDTKTDLVFTQEEIQGLMNDSTKLVWGQFAGSGETIELTFAEYFQRFVYDADFINQAQISLNKAENKGTMINNINDVYPADSYDFVEYYIDGVDPAYDGMDWRSLRLVFEKVGQDHILVGIVHDEWTP